MKLWPITLLWRWDDRHYRRRYGYWTHATSTEGKQDGGWVLHLGPVKVRFG